MSEERIKKLFRKGDGDLTVAQDELFKPKEDVVNYSACISARSALYHFLGCLYLLHYEDEKETIEEGSKTLEELLENAGNHYQDLEKMDFSFMRCKCDDIKDILNNEEIYFCNNVSVVQTCTNLAKEVKELVIDNALGGTVPGSSPVSD